MAALVLVLLFCANNFYLTYCHFVFDKLGNSSLEPDVCNDNTLDRQQVLDFLANGKEWLNVAMINKNNPGLENVQEWWVNPKYKFEAVPGSGGEDINVNIIAHFPAMDSCSPVGFPSLKVEEVTVATNERCQRITGRSTDTFAVIKPPAIADHPEMNLWFRIFSQTPGDYIWFFMCDNGPATTTYDYDSCQQGHMDLLITDPRIAPTDNINVEESNNLWGTIVSDDTRYIGQTAQVAHLWQEGKPECDMSESETGELHH